MSIKKLDIAEMQLKKRILTTSLGFFDTCSNIMLCISCTYIMPAVFILYWLPGRPALISESSIS